MSSNPRGCKTVCCFSLVVTGAPFVGYRAGLQARVLVQQKRDLREHAFVVEHRNAVAPPFDDGDREVIEIANGFGLVG